MIRTTQKELKRLVATGEAVNVTNFGIPEYEELKKKEGYFTTLAYSSGLYGCSGLLLQGDNTGTKYSITHRSTALYIFG